MTAWASILSLSRSLCGSLSRTHVRAHAHTLALSLFLTHARTLALSLFLTHAHTLSHKRRMLMTEDSGADEHIRFLSLSLSLSLSLTHTHTHTHTHKKDTDEGVGTKVHPTN